MKWERIEVVSIDHLDVKVQVNTVRALRMILGLTVLAQPHLAPLYAPAWGSGTNYSLLGPSVPVPGLVFKFPQPWPSLDQALLLVHSPAQSQSLPLPSKVLSGAPRAAPSDPTALLAPAVGQDCLPNLGIPQGSQFPAHTELLAHTSP